MHYLCHSRRMSLVKKRSMEVWEFLSMRRIRVMMLGCDTICLWQLCDSVMLTIVTSFPLTGNRNCLLRYDLDTFNILYRRSPELISRSFFNSVSTLWTRLVKVNPDSPCAWACNVGWVHNLLFVCCWPYLDRTRKTRSWRFGRPFDFSQHLFNKLRHLMRILYVNEQMMPFCRVYTMIRRMHTTNSCR